MTLGSGSEQDTKQDVTTDQRKSLDLPPPPVVTNHEITLDRQLLPYEAAFGLMPIQNVKGEIEATLSYTYYRATGAGEDEGSRPLTFLFNGGPGSASVWLHLGGIGPRRVRMDEDGAMPPPPFQVIDNDYTWLTFSDLVFVDPVDTGYSKAANEELTKKFLSVQGDLDLTGEFIRRFLSRYNRWTSPLFVAGESYGTFRSAGLAGNLVDKGIAFNGVILVSSVLELGTLLFESGDDLPYILYLPSYAATAWYHHALEPFLQEGTLGDLLKEVEIWTTDVYTIALARGNDLPGEDRQEVVGRLSRYTGISEDQIDRWNLRINGARFCNELLRSSRRVVGRLDSRHTGFDPDSSTDGGEFDPSMSAIRPPFTAAFNSYVRGALGYETEEEYHILRELDWAWGDRGDGAPRTNTELEQAFSRNPYLHLLVLSGNYDLATPYFATQYTLGRLRLDPAVRAQISTVNYPGGHMMYVARDILEKMQADVAAFVSTAIAVVQQPLRPGNQP